MSITEILEKYRITDADGCEWLVENPGLERDLSQLLEDRAKEFAKFIASDYNRMYDEDGVLFWRHISTKKRYVTSELYALFLTNKNKTDEANPNQ